ncbi:hypothetical protein BZA05DRAFT_33082 [Tricharina praecox]|uniref:uncharacterized protein n=1 Tax=Tricharina praecox TaxID=43433 RepID=UPI002220D096|nr:uncharacterized protein BZA05DRAFT_33082 [Tricharina praecox]KAI5853565.1 hypothetical protein BZA05DRAFT_33082 [Tricharina praecox]
MASGPITLVPATLKEASLDSPTFRGTVIHYAEQVDLVEKWLDGFIKASVKLVSEVVALEDPINNFLARTVPGNISESVVDHDYTLLAMQRYAEGSKGFWTNIVVGARRVQNNIIEPMTTFQRGEVKNFKETRRLLEAAQTKYDALLARYLSQSKSKEPSALREDAFQLYEARKAYSKTCFDFCIAAPAFRINLDRLLTKVISNQWREQIGLRKDMAGLVEKCSSDIERIRSCYDSMEVNESVFRKQLTTARKELERRAKMEYQPARELDEYSLNTVPYLTSRPPAVVEGEEVPSEKQGWLFMRTLTGKPTRTLWIRRWFFIKAGIFGWLVQGYRGGGAEESEKVGVLLCNIKPAFQEERRFCFEVKTKDTTILLQTETQSDLTMWMAVFEQAKRAAVESSSLVASSQAFSILPPSAPAPPAEPAYVTRGHDGNSASSVVPPEGLSLLPRTIRRDADNHGFERATTLGPGTGGAFSRGTTSMDANRGGAPEPSNPVKSDPRKASFGMGERNISPVGMGSTPVGISALIAASHNLLPISPDPAKQITMTLPEVQVPTASSLAPNTLSSTPSPVNLLTAATVTSGSGITGITERSPVTAPEKGHRKTMSLDVGGNKGDSTPGEYEYFPGYPMALRVQDEHFRMLFPGTHDHVVQLVFRAIWSPNDTQELPGRCFVTDRNLYFYSHYLGLVFTSITPLATIAEVKAAPEKDCDYLFLHLNLGAGGEKSLITIKTFLEPLRLLHRRLDLMVRNAHPKAAIEGTKMNSQELLQQLIELEKEVESRGSDDMSWEDVGLYTDGRGDEPISRRRGAPEEFRLRLDHDGDRALDEKAREAKLKLPSAPVVYHPPGMSRRSLEREFEIPPKALFHVLFGDKSTVFQMMYAQRRAQPIQQSPWKELDKGKARRQFAYHATFLDTFGRNRRADVVDHQTIEKQDEHICYVVTDVKTPWHLPHRMNFIMVSKIVITHVTASKSKLTVWTRVDWFKDPMFSKNIVQQQAQEDLDNDALDLGDVVAEAIGKLGKSANVLTAMQIFGGINGQTVVPATPSAGAITGIQPKQDTPPKPIHAPRIPIKQHSLSQMLLENTLSLAESAVSNVIMSIVAVVKGIAGLFSAHWILLGLLGFSVVANTALSTRAVTAYWSERRAHALLESISAAPDGTMARAITISDLELAVAPAGNITHPSGGMCWSKFLSRATSGDGTMGQRIHGGRETLGRYRHDLVVAVRVVNALERELVKAEWERWVYGELERCRFAARLLRSMEGVEGIDGLQGAHGLEEYCGDCELVRAGGVM